ncbi:helix-turn-helix domain-containing protein [Bacillus sp. FJAT-49736]|uniref:helix-turn-helix domain-containing protein n=1 Tax=Bacillus sp. FJAT-49736 TaxID=2833582 RepID=UPI001BC9F252|nr:helix-turn-helix domain-containing protein [Bacillus sp. FJAT-49736]MBS4174727.1 helix-turn-helix domain-containing protein [Bacillus sp. FJAT-49736]
MIKILIADRDEFEAKGIQWLITSSISNADVLVAVHLDDTLLMLEKEQPDIFIYDMNIGNMESIERLLNIMEPNLVCLTMEATYESAKKAIDLGAKSLLIKPFSPQELLKQINSIIRKHLRKQQNTLFPSNLDARQEVVYEELFMEESKNANPYVFIAFQPEKASYLPELNRFIKEYMFPAPPIIFPLSDMFICLFKKTRDADWEETGKRFLHDWELEEKEPICIIINDEKDNQLTIHDKYIRTRRMAEVTFFVGYQQVLHFVKPLEWDFIDPFLTPDEQRQWISFLNEGDKEGISEFLTREFLNFSNPYPDPGLLRIRLTSILAQIRRYMKSANIDLNKFELEYLGIFDTILYDPLIYRIVQKLLIFTSELVDSVFDSTRNQHMELMDKCIHYMELNYWKAHLDLRNVADFVGRNPTYISYLFVKKTGKTFRERLTLLRMREAKKLLEETELAIKEISILTGFHNQHYFSRVFKKMVGKTPKQYRQRY